MVWQAPDSRGIVGRPAAEEPPRAEPTDAVQPGVEGLLAAGLAHHQAGRLAEAAAHYRQILIAAPDHADALHLLGGIAYQFGQPAAAIELIDRAIAQNGGEPSYHCSRALALQALERLEEAVGSYDQALALKPDYATALINRGLVLHALARCDEALTSYEQALAVAPEFAEAWLNRGNTLQQLGRLPEALASYDHALALRPDLVEAYYNQGEALRALQRLAEAVESYDRALALKPDFVEILHNRGSALHQLRRSAEALASYDQALALRPELAEGHMNRGHVLQSLGRFDDARAAFRRALELDPDLIEAHRGLALTGEGARDELELRHLHSLMTTPEHPVLDRVSAGFTLGSLLDKADRYDEAFLAFAQANALYRQHRAAEGVCFDAGAFGREVDRLIAIAGPGFPARLAAWGNPSELPVFVVGMPRSGTTLVEQIAASHSQVFGAGERGEIGEIAGAMAAHNGDCAVEAWDAAFAREQADRYVARLQGLGGASARVIDKMPDNLFALWLIAALFPSARVILSRRDLRDTALSCYFSWFIKGHEFSCDLADCGRRGLEVERLATHWLETLPLKMLVVDYEKLVVNPADESRRLIGFLGLDWEPACLDFHQTERPVFTASSWQVRQPIYTRAIGRWRHYRGHLAPLLEVLAQTGD